MVGLLYSQIGYDIGDPKRALLRSTEENKEFLNIDFEIIDANGKHALKKKTAYWGYKWKSYWWVLDFTEIEKPDFYYIIIKNNNKVLYLSDKFEINEDVLWKKTIYDVAITQLEKRSKLATNGKTGWKDCGANMKEANSHATMIIGLCDLIGTGFTKRIDDGLEKRIINQIVIGCDYLLLCQKKAKSIGFEEGAIVHEIPNHMIVIPGDVAQSAVALSYASRLMVTSDFHRSENYLNSAVMAYEYLVNNAKPYGKEGFSGSNHGVNENFEVPSEWMTRDLLMMMWAGIELCASGLIKYKEKVYTLATQIMRRQVPKTEAEDGFYGHFYTFSSSKITEKANIHHHVGHDTGGTFPYYIAPFIDMLRRWPDHKDAPLWHKTVENFTYGYLIPACNQNPFYLLPEGYFENEGILNFCGPWHGINVSIGFIAALAAKIEGYLGERQLRNISVGNIQWIAGLNVGLTSNSFEGCVKWKPIIPEGVAIPFSQIVGIGNRSVECWTNIKGTIPNGFSANKQFQLSLPNTKENDGPWNYTDEDWIPHSAGWISALSHLNEIKFYSSYND